MQQPSFHAQPDARRPVTIGNRLSIVVPCYNEEEVLPETAKRLRALLDQLTNGGKIAAESQVVFVDDGSQDHTWELIRQSNAEDARIRGLKLSGNRGHQTALIAGLFAADGDAIVSIDADLQDDISAIEGMVDAYRQGYEVIYGVRKSRGVDSVFKRSAAKAYCRVLALLNVKIIPNHADFRLLSRRALESLKEYSEVNLFLRGIVPLLGYRSSMVYYDRAERFAGQSKYPLRKILSLALDGVTSFTIVPLRIITFIGIFVSLLSIGMIFWVLWVKLFTLRAVPGWASSVIPIYFLGGIQLLGIGVLGEYIAKLYFEAKRRPRYFIDERL
jgi:glycosyltransferase involved in cell wall biosynthesis